MDAKTKVLKHGDKVRVRLTVDHKLAGDCELHQATFIGRLHGQDWAQVELEKEHAGGTKILHVPLDAIE